MTALTAVTALTARRARPLVAVLLTAVLALAPPPGPAPAVVAAPGPGTAGAVTPGVAWAGPPQPPPEPLREAEAVLPAGTGSRTSSRAAGAWRPPVAGGLAVLRPFAPGPQPWSPGHRGVDVALPAGAPVLAAGAGVVTFAGPVAGRGVVTVTHGPLRTTYEPLLPAVRAGDRVLAGSPLGVLAAGHLPCGSCLHWGLRRGEDYLNPLRLLRPTRVRLLPLGPAR